MIRSVKIKRYFFLLLVPMILFSASACKKEKPVDNDSVSSNDFLSSSNYEKLVVEVVSVTGYEPTETAINNLLTFLNQRLNKPAGIAIVQSSINSPGKASYSATDIRDIENDHRTQKTIGTTLTAFIFFADADYSGNAGNSKVLGIAYDPSSMAIFKKTIQEFSGGITQPTEEVLESSTLLHEFCHILGLVNNGTPSQSAHEDLSHAKHCNNEDCLMYWLVENSDVAANLLGGNIPQLDAACIADLKANGGK